MPLEEVIAGVTFQGFATTPPTIAGLQALGIFGTTKDGLNTNRAPGGPTFVNLTNPPTIGNSWITVNNGTATSTPTQGIDTAFLETTAVIASGWTLFAIARTMILSGNATFISIGPGQSTCLVLNPSNSLISNHPSFWIQAQGVAFTSPEHIIDINPTTTSTWRMYALSFPAGAGARAFTLYDVTGNVSKTTTATQNRVQVGSPSTNHVNFGNSSNTAPANVYQNADVAVGGVTTGVLSMGQLQSIRTWLLGVMAVRSVTGF